MPNAERRLRAELVLLGRSKHDYSVDEQLGDEEAVVELFRDIRAYCDERGLNYEGAFIEGMRQEA